MAQEQVTSATLTSKKSKKNFPWEERHVEDKLINCIISYKTKMENKPQMYKKLRESMAERNVSGC